METIVASPEPEQPEEQPEALTYSEQAENFRVGRREALTNVASAVKIHEVHQEALTNVATVVTELKNREFSRV
jgi:hypothetical protein